jgi:hypothetical protein
LIHHATQVVPGPSKGKKPKLNPIQEIEVAEEHDVADDEDEDEDSSSSSSEDEDEDEIEGDQEAVKKGKVKL